MENKLEYKKYKCKNCGEEDDTQTGLCSTCRDDEEEDED
jgi:predicted ATP-dependent serine protease